MYRHSIILLGRLSMRTVLDLVSMFQPHIEGVHEYQQDTYDLWGTVGLSHLMILPNIHSQHHK